jgi:hypothetical protein
MIQTTTEYRPSLTTWTPVSAPSIVTALSSPRWAVWMTLRTP